MAATTNAVWVFSERGISFAANGRIVEPAVERRTLAHARLARVPSATIDFRFVVVGGQGDRPGRAGPGAGPCADGRRDGVG